MTHITSQNIVLITPRGNLVELVIDMSFSADPEHIIHFLHGDSLPFEARGKQPDQEQRDGIKTAA